MLVFGGSCVIGVVWSRGRRMGIGSVSSDPGGRPEGWPTLVTSPMTHFFCVRHCSQKVVRCLIDSVVNCLCERRQYFVHDPRI